MASFFKCQTADGQNVRVNFEHVALIRPYHSDRAYQAVKSFSRVAAPARSSWKRLWSNSWATSRSNAATARCSHQSPLDLNSPRTLPVP